ncbi:unnamed protein product [Dovyalis caffra]|uniref:Pentatricopeptide repeat-containing protein n=1 Tax=Dovyalis caffra TaxID=77055 RepID=A0AAV1R5T7_9ROSI|nr:unnamed protein product [Dovyalis caffra]
MARMATELAARISRALITESNSSIPTRSWSPSLEQTLHKIGCRELLNPSLVARVIDPHLLTHHSLALGFFNWASQQPGFTHNSLTYQSVFKSLSFSRQFNATESLLKQAKAQNLTLDSSSYRFVIDSLIKRGKTQAAFSVFNEIKSQSLDLGTDSSNSLLSALGSDGCFDNAMKVFVEMTTRGTAFSTIGFGVFIWRLCRNGDLGEVLRLIDEARRGNSMINGSVIAVLIVHGLCEGSRTSEALWALSELRIRGWKPDFIAYRVVAEAFRSLGSVFDVNEVLKMKRKLGVAPRSNDYREFILGLITERRIYEAKELAKVIASGNFPIEDDVLNALIGSVSSIDPYSAMEFFHFVIGKGKIPTLLTLSNLSRNLCKHGKIDELLEVYRVLSSNEYFSDIESYNVMFLFLCKAGRVREAYEVLQEMRKKGLGPDISMYNSLIEVLCREDLLRPAKRLWDEMFVIGCGGNLKTYNILIGKFSEIGQVDEAMGLFNHMLEKRVTPDATTHTSLLEALCQETKFETAVEVFNKYASHDIVIAQSILKTLILNFCGKGQFLVASKFLCSLTHEGGHSDAHVVLLKCLADSKEIPIAVEHVKQIGGTHHFVAKPPFTCTLIGNISIVKELYNCRVDIVTSRHPCLNSQCLSIIRAAQEENSNLIKDQLSKPGLEVFRSPRSTRMTTEKGCLVVRDITACSLGSLSLRSHFTIG